MNRILITGGAGFIGSHLATRLVRNGFHVTVVDNLSTGSKNNIPSGSEFQFLDIATEGWTEKIDGRFDIVFHLAAQSSGEISFEDPTHDAKTNVHGTLSLLQWCKATGVKNFVFASSMNIYGDVPDTTVDENTPSQPKSYYGVAKMAAENYVRLFNSNDLRTVSLRLFNVYGPRQNLSNLKQGMLSIYCSYLLEKKPIIVKGSLDRFRDFIFIEDVVDLLELTVYRDLNRPVYNVCTGTKITVKQAVNTIIKAFGFSDYPIEQLTETPGDQFGIYGSNQLLSRELDWTPNYSLDQGIECFVDFLIKMKKANLSSRRDSKICES